MWQHLEGNKQRERKLSYWEVYGKSCRELRTERPLDWPVSCDWEPQRKQACKQSPSCHGVKLEGQRTWGTEMEHEIYLMVCMERKKHSWDRTTDTFSQGRKGKAAAQEDVHKGRLRTVEIAEEGITAPTVMFLLPLFGTELAFFQPFEELLNATSVFPPHSLMTS